MVNLLEFVHTFVADDAVRTTFREHPSSVLAVYDDDLTGEDVEAALDVVRSQVEPAVAARLDPTDATPPFPPLTPDDDESLTTVALRCLRWIDRRLADDTSGDDGDFEARLLDETGVEPPPPLPRPTPDDEPSTSIDLGPVDAEPNAVDAEASDMVGGAVEPVVDGERDVEAGQTEPDQTEETEETEPDPILAERVALGDIVIDRTDDPEPVIEEPFDPTAIFGGSADSDPEPAPAEPDHDAIEDPAATDNLDEHVPEPSEFGEHDEPTPPQDEPASSGSLGLPVIGDAPEGFRGATTAGDGPAPAAPSKGLGLPSLGGSMSLPYSGGESSYDLPEARDDEPDYDDTLPDDRDNAAPTGADESPSDYFAAEPIDDEHHEPSAVYRSDDDTPRFRALDTVLLPEGIPEVDIPPGIQATIVAVHTEPSLHYEIEVDDADGNPTFLGTVTPETLAPLPD